MKTKHLLSALFFLIVPFLASAYSFEVDGIYYYILDDGATVGVTNSGSNNSYSGDVVIPDTVINDGTAYPVTAIRGKAFKDCTSLTSITIPKSIIWINASAFYNCSGMTAVYITDISAWCNIFFEDTYSNPLYNNVGNLYLNGELVTDLVIPKGVTALKSYAFIGCKSIKSVTIPDGVKTIDYQVFRYCSNLETITIPNSVTIVNGNSFDGCTSLKSITLPEGVTYIGGEAFNGCKNLASITLPSTLKSIDDYAFSGCSNLSAVCISDVAAWCNIVFDVKYSYALSSPLSIAGNLYLNGELVTDLVIPEGVTNINYRSFSGCRSITSITIPSSLKSIGGEAFLNCSNLKNVYISDLAAWCNISHNKYNNALHVADNLYLNGELITDLVIPDNVTKISDRAFESFINIKSVTIPNSVTSIGVNAFEYCSNLNTAIIHAVNIGNASFWECPQLESVTIGKEVKSIGTQAFYNCNKLNAVHISDMAAWCNISFGNEDSNPLKFSSNLYLNNKLVTNLTIPNEVAVINSYAFYGYKYLTSVTIPSSVKTIKSYAFQSCINLASLTMQEGVTTIQQVAFRYCTNLTEITLPESVTSIGNNVFNTVQVCRANAATPPSLGSSAFASGALVFVPAGSKEAYQNATNWKNYTIAEECEAEVTVTVPGELALDLLDQTGMVPTQISKLIVHGEINATDIELMKSSMSGCTYIDLSDAVIESLPDECFKGKNKLQTILLPEGCKTIGIKAFSGCTALANIGLPAQLTTIGSNAFENCTSLKTDLLFPEGVTAIGNNAFYNCTSLQRADFSQTAIDAISASLFEGCRSLHTVVVSPTLQKIAASAFKNCSRLGDMQLPQTMTSIGVSAFEGCSSLTTIDLKGSMLTEIGATAFKGCSKLATVEIGGCAVSQLGASAFENCKQLKAIDLSASSLTSIAASMFSECTALQSVSLPATITSLSDKVFYNCTALQNLSVPCTVPPTVSTNTLYNVDAANCLFSFPSSAMSDYLLSDTWSVFLSQHKSVKIAITGDGSVWFANEGTVPAWAATGDGQNVYVPNNGTVTFSAQPVEGANFIKWSDGVTDNPRTMTITNRLSLTAEFTYTTPAYQLTVQVNDETMGSVTGGGLYEEGATATIEAKANEGYVFVEWSDGNTENPREITVTGDLTLTAEFEQEPIIIPTYQLTIQSGNAIMGSVTGGGTYDEGSTVTIEATANEGYHFVQWSDGNTENPRTIKVTANLTLTAEFAQDAPPTTFLQLADQTAFVGQELVLPIEMINEEEVTALQFDLHLPAGVEVQTNDKGKYLFELTDRVDDHSINSKLQADGSIRVMLVSMSSAAFYGNEGAVMNIPLSITSAAVDGEYEVKLTGISMVTPNETEIKQTQATATLTIANYVQGDANGDGEVSLVDVVKTINYILGSGATDFVFAAADVNGDGEVALLDVVKIINMVLDDGVSAAPARAAKEVPDYGLSLTDFTLAAGETKTVSVEMNNVGDITAVQFDIKFPEGVTIATKSNGKPIVSLTDRADDHSLNSKLQADGSLRVIVVSMSSAPFYDNSGAIVEIEVTAADDLVEGIHPVEVTNISMVSPDEVEHKPADFIHDFSTGSAEEGEYNLTMTNFSLDAGENKTVSVEMNNTGDITAVQFDIKFPEGVTIATKSNGKPIVSLTDRADDHSLNSKLQADGSLRVIVVSMSSAPFYDNSGAIVEIEVVADSELASGMHPVEVTNISMVSPDEIEYRPADFTHMFSTVPSGVENVAGDNIGVTALNREILILGAADGTPVEVYDLSGTLLYGGTDHRIAIANQGIYLVRVAGKTHKVVL